MTAVNRYIRMYIYIHIDRNDATKWKMMDVFWYLKERSPNWFFSCSFSLEFRDVCFHISICLVKQLLPFFFKYTGSSSHYKFSYSNNLSKILQNEKNYENFFYTRRYHSNGINLSIINITLITNCDFISIFLFWFTTN